MRRAVAADFATLPGVRVVLTRDTALPPAPGPWREVVLGPGEERAALASLARDVDALLVVAPETGGVLADRVALVLASGGRVLNATPRAIALATDKFAAAARLAALGLQVVPGVPWRPGTPWPAEVRSPAVLKPIDGAGCIETWVIDDPHRLPAGLPAHTSLLQPFHPGMPASVSFVTGLCGPAGSPREIVVGACRQTIDRVGDRLVYRGGLTGQPLPRALLPALRRALRTFEGLAGWIGVDLMLGPGPDAWAVLEVNPRLTTSYVGLRETWGSRLALCLIRSAGLVLADPGPPRACAWRQPPRAFTAAGNLRPLPTEPS
jgi:predicted ATP-grasp superfamily ATP-dependent carboligase